MLSDDRGLYLYLRAIYRLIEHGKKPAFHAPLYKR
jgi:hypothetical protein